MPASFKTLRSALPRLPALLFTALLAVPASPYDVPLSESSIRDAYFLGTRTDGLNFMFLAQYSRSVPNLKQGDCISNIAIETPFLQIAKYSREATNYSAQDAVKDFYGRAMPFRVYLDICYEPNAPPNAIKVKVTQNKKEVIPLSFESAPYAQATDFGYLAPNGEQITMEFKPEKMESSALTVLIDTPDGQHAETLFDLQTIR